MSLQKISKVQNWLPIKKIYGKKIFIGFSFYWLRGFPGGSAGKESAYNAKDVGVIPGLERSHMLQATKPTHENY